MKLTHSDSIRFLLVLSLVAGLGSCCGEHLAFWNISDMEVKVVNISTNQFEEDSINVTSFEDFYIAIANEVEYVSSIWTEASEFLIRNSYAFQCPDPGEDGMKDPIKAIFVHSSNVFDTISAGRPLNDFILVDNVNTIDEFIEHAPNIQAFSGETIGLSFTIDPAPSSHVFTVEIETESGIVFEDQSIQVTWE